MFLFDFSSDSLHQDMCSNSLNIDPDFIHKEFLWIVNCKCKQMLLSFSKKKICSKLINLTSHVQHLYSWHSLKISRLGFLHQKNMRLNFQNSKNACFRGKHPFKKNFSCVSKKFLNTKILNGCQIGENMRSKSWILKNGYQHPKWWRNWYWYQFFS